MRGLRCFLIAVLLAVFPAAAQERTKPDGTSNAPGGIKLRWYDVIDEAPVDNDRQMIGWGATGEQVEAQLGEDHYADWKGEDSWLLGTAKYGGWWADFGDDSPRAYPTTLFFIDGKFFRYFVQISPERFELVERTLTKAVGKPTSSETSTVETRMGAEFDQEIRIWEFADVDIHLMKRAARVTEGLLSVTYKPLAAEVPEDTAEAPF